MKPKIVKSVYLKSNPNPRHILVFLDGTWNDENGRENDGVTTSIYRLFCAVKGEMNKDELPHTITSKTQVALYFRGLGNDDEKGMVGSFFEGAFGAGEKRIRDNAYCQILAHYRKGDKLSIFGFSRGAACARMLAQSLKNRGLYDSCKVHYEDKLGSNSEKIFKKYSDEKRNARQKVDVEFLGIFDTVGAFGIPIDLGFSFQKINLFKNMNISPNVKQVVHCVSIDETREPFKPTLCNHGSNVDEVWFAGVHADIGGGYRHRELAAYPLNYMLKRLDQYFSQDMIVFDEALMKQLTHVDADANINMHYHGDGVKKDPRHVYVLEKDAVSRRRNPRIHQSVFDLMRHDKVYLADNFHSFAAVQKILYSPRGIGSFKEKSVATK